MRHPGVASTGAVAGGEEEDQEMEAEAEAATGEALGLRALRLVERKRTNEEMEAEAARPTMGHETTKAQKQGCTRTNLGSALN